MWKYIALGNKEGATVKDDGWKYRGLSYFTRLNYNYNDKYMLMFTFRADGSSKYNDKWGYFPSIGAAWVISQEPFMKNQNIFDYMKLRASWGKLGNDKIAASAGFASIQNVQSVFGPNTAIDGFINTTNFSWLGWEVVNETNVGVNFSTLKNRLNADIDWYYRLTDNAVISPKLPMSGELLAGNNGQILNTGIDLSLNWNDKIGQDFNYNIGVNLSYLHNEVKSLKGNMKIIKGGKTVNMVGETMNSFYGYKVIGIYQTPEQCAADPIAVANGLEPGDFIYEDVNGDHVIDGNDKQVLAHTCPALLMASMPDSLIRTSTSASLPTDKQAANCGTVSVPCAMQPTTITLTVHSMRTAGRVQALPTNIRRPRLFSKPGTNQTVTTLPIS